MRCAAVSPALIAVAVLCVVASAVRCDCAPQITGPAVRVGDGDPIGPPDAGDVYQADAGPVVCQDDVHEDNDSRASAVPVGVTQIEGTVCGSDDDWYSVASRPGCAVLAQVTQQSGALGDIDMLMFDPDAQLVGAVAGLDAVEAINVTSSQEGAYTVRLRAGSRDNAPYALTLTSTCAAELTCPQDDRLEDNDAASSAASLLEDVAHDGILCIGDEDWFLVPATIGCIADARLEFSNDVADIDLELHRADGITRIANSAGSEDGERITKVVTEGGMRYRVFLFSASAVPNPYRFIVEQTCAGQIACPSDDPFEPNDAIGQARRLFGPIDEVIGTICASDDFFDVIPQQGCTVHATLDLRGADGDLDLELLQANDGSRIDSSADTGDVEQVDYAAPNTSRLVLRVFAIGDASNSYRLRLSTTCP